MAERLAGEEVRAIRLGMNVSEVEFAMMLGVTMRTVQLWESDVVVPSVLTSMVIRAAAAKRMGEPQAPSTASTLGVRRARVARPLTARAGKRGGARSTPTPAPSAPPTSLRSR